MMNHAIHKPLFGKQESQESIQESRNQAKNLKIPESRRRKFRVSDPSLRNCLQLVTWKIVCHWLLPLLMLLQCVLKYLPCSAEWIDVYYKHICGNISILWNRSFMIARATQHPCRLQTAKSLKQAMNPAYFIIRLQV